MLESVLVVTMSSEAAELEADVKNLPGAWAAVVYSRPLASWKGVPDVELPIPHEFIAVRAFHLFAQKGSLHGSDVADWLCAERQLRRIFREFSAGLIEEGCVESKAGGSAGADCFAGEPIQGDMEDANRSTLWGGMSSDGLLDARRGTSDKMSEMRNRNSLGKKEPDPPLEAELQTYRDAIGEMTSEERERYRGKVLAILCETGEIVAAESTAEELKSAVGSSQFRDRPWRLMDGPGSEPPLTVDEFLKLHGERSVGG